MPLILAFDTSTPTASVALLEWQAGTRVSVLADLSGRTLARRDQPVSTHGKALVPLIEEVLAEAQVRPKQIDVVSCGAGPGSFTGVRVGLATAKGLCFALDIPLVLPRSLDAVAARALGGSSGPAEKVTLGFGAESSGHEMTREGCADFVMACMDARRGEVYVAGWIGDAGLRAMAEAGSGRWLEDRAVRPEDFFALVIERFTQYDGDDRAGTTPGSLLKRGDSAVGRGDSMRGGTRSLVCLGTGLDLIRSNVGRMGEDAGISVGLRDDLDPWPDAVALAGIGGMMLDQGQMADLDGAQPIYLRPSDAEAKFGLSLSPQGGQ
ncbi:MAG: tRNA (adenosine(37)-N6)-threonylcarbamoyltransferase complex dimerization subunit type 1 TsaB [Deltaproteobacteria bacterium]|nr:tRNA (adenosine(37)-N6)-threonylcarbamoyltransferase complex dimerization subunit type 1 TsaB [Deltaproteobacteria bacterium]